LARADPARSRELAALSDIQTDVDRLGWCLGVLAAAQEIDVLLERREREGLAAFVAVVCAARGVTLVPPAERSPPLSTTSGKGWEVPLAWGCVFFAVARRSDAIAWRCELEAQHVELAISLPRSFSARERADLLALAGGPLELFDAGRLEAAGEDARLVLPRRWFGV
jgi:hypothetical protein